MPSYFYHILLFASITVVVSFILKYKKKSALQILQQVAERNDYSFAKTFGYGTYEVPVGNETVTIYCSISGYGKRQDGVLLSKKGTNSILEEFFIRKKFKKEEYDLKKLKGKLLVEDFGYNENLRLYTDYDNKERAIELLEQNHELLDGIVEQSKKAYTFEISQLNDWIKVDFRVKGILKSPAQIETAIDEIVELYQKYMDMTDVE